MVYGKRKKNPAVLIDLYDQNAEEDVNLNLFLCSYLIHVKERTLLLSERQREIN